MGRGIIGNNMRRQVTFCKRRNGLLKKAYDELCAVLYYAVHVVTFIVIFSSRGRLYEQVRQQQMPSPMNKWTLLAVGSFLLWSVLPVESFNSSDWNFYCGNETFQEHSNYEKILIYMAEEIPAQVSIEPSYFLSTSYGSEPDQIYGAGQCREDSSPEDCETCIRQAFQALGAPDRCRLKKVGALTNQMCSLWISYREFMDTMDFNNKGIGFLGYNTTTSSRVPVDSHVLGKIATGLVWAVAAETAKSASHFAMSQQQVIGGNGSTLYAFAECIPTVTRSDCRSCLEDEISANVFLETSMGGYSCALWCQFRWELYPFVIGMMTPTVPAEGKHSSENWKRDFVILSAVVGFAVLVAAIIFSVRWWRHRSTTPAGDERVETTSSENKDLETGEGSLSKVPEPVEEHIGDACANMDLPAIHKILVATQYKEDEGSPDEPSFEGWTQHGVLATRKRGDAAFECKQFRIAIEAYSEYVNAATKVSPTVYARRCLCYIMCEDSHAALRDALLAQSVRADWPTAFFMQSVALSKMDMHTDALDMLNEASRLEEMRRHG